MNELKPLILYSIGNITAAKITANNLDGYYVNTKYDRDFGAIRGMLFSQIILLDNQISEEYIHCANKRILLDYDKTSRSWDKAIEGGDYTAEVIYNPNTKEIINVRRL